MLYIVMASIGEYSDRTEWICGIYEQEEIAKALIEEYSAKARDFEQALTEYYLKHKTCRAKYGITYTSSIPQEVWNKVKEEIGPYPESGELLGNIYWLVKVPLNQWGVFTNNASVA